MSCLWNKIELVEESEQEVSFVARKILASFLILFFSFGLTKDSVAALFKQELTKTHLRWNFFIPKETLVLEKKHTKVFLKTLNSDFYKKLKDTINELSLDSRYIKKLSSSQSENKDNVPTVVIELSDPSVEVFGFYRDRERKYVLDFWKDKEKSELRTIEKIQNTQNVTDQKKNLQTPKKREAVKKVASKPSLVKRAPAQINPKKLKNKHSSNKNLFRDYRYGAAFVWDYPELKPKLEKIIDINSKTVEYFYPIKDRDFKKNEKEAHYQLIINFYRRKKYGLMYKSMKLFRDRYGGYSELNEYLKANAILRDNIKTGNLESLKMAVNMLINIEKGTQNYELKKSIVKYLIQYYMNNKESIEALKFSKRLYVDSKENFDYEESRYAIKAILHNLAELSQADKIREIINDKSMSILTSEQVLIAYEIYALRKIGKTERVVDTYKKIKKNLSKQVLPSILYNVAESYFRLGKFEKSIALFDKFLSQHSYHKNAEMARVRVALAYEMTERNIDQTLALYKNAINRAQSFEIKTEAKVRYVGMRSVRKKVLNNSDRESKVLLEIDPKKKLSKNLKKILWLVRLRSFINEKEYSKALSYLEALPLIELKPSERRVFHADGSEVIYGLVLNYYKQANYSKILKVWSQYKKKYISQAANDPYLNFIVGQTYLKLGLYEGFEKVYADFKKLSKSLTKTFPIWVERYNIGSTDDVMLELNIVRNIKLENLDLANSDINQLAQKRPGYEKIDYYQGLVNFKEKNYKNTIKSFENFFTKKKEVTIFDPQDLAYMMQSYTTSLYELNLLDKFAKISNAILNDTENYAPSNPFIKELRKNLEYLNIEILIGKGTAAAYLQVEPKISKFLSQYPDSDVRGRMYYLQGLCLIKNKKRNQAREVLEKLMKENGVSNYIRELAKSELSLLNIKEKIL